MTRDFAAPEDLDLLERIARGDADALGALYDRHAPRVLGLTTRILSDPDEAEDVLQEVFLQVWRTPARFDPARGSVVTWLLVLGRSRAIDRLRSLRRRGRDLQVEIESVPLASGHDIEREAQTAQAGGAVRRALAGLPAEQRRALELAYFGGYTQTEIAELTRTPLGTVKTRLRQGMIKLRDGFSSYSKRGPLTAF
jgi:RNA polymerase sigma-70 factor, ECF subfamily